MCWTRFWAASQKRQNVCPGQLPPNGGLEILSSLANAPGLPITSLGCSCHWVDSPGTHTPPPPGSPSDRACRRLPALPRGGLVKGETG